MSNHPTQLSVSIVSHGHRSYVVSLLQDLARLNRSDLEVILTWNILEEKIDLSGESLPFRLTVIDNQVPKGYAANHNQAFEHCNGDNFVILNPDISLPADPFSALLHLLEHYAPCICAPLIKATDNSLEDSARFFPSPFSLAKKAAAKIFRVEQALDKIPDDGGMLNPDWIAGMFIVVPRQIYKDLRGLEESYHLYYEDVDFCARARLNGIEVYVSKTVYAVHHAQRQSHKSLRYFGWHLKSAAKFFTSKAYFICAIRKMKISN
jgi:N-acetylglucosaminyl-diphospho-decaprenol L-rhamnosyltransferase